MSDSKVFWFKKRDYGWGWTPSNRYGWSVVLVYIFTILSTTMFFEAFSRLQFGFFIFISTVTLLIICYLKGEAPSWSWGKNE